MDSRAAHYRILAQACRRAPTFRLTTVIEGPAAVVVRRARVVMPIHWLWRGTVVHRLRRTHGLWWAVVRSLWRTYALWRAIVRWARICLRTVITRRVRHRPGNGITTKSNVDRNKRPRLRGCPQHTSQGRDCYETTDYFKNSFHIKSSIHQSLTYRPSIYSTPGNGRCSVKIRSAQPCFRGLQRS
jgi:hypothetical protein